MNKDWTKLNVFIMFLVDEYLQRAKDKHGYNMEQVPV